MRDFLKNQATDWTHVFITGFFDTKSFLLNKPANFALLSRRDKSRAGMRFLSRGSDKNGNVSNFVETEQILTIHQNEGFDLYSYLQIRGSIPFYWSQWPTVKYAPKTELLNIDSKDDAAYLGHRNHLLKEYKETMCLNLIDKKTGSGQQKLGKRFYE